MKKFHRLGRWSLSLGMAMGVAHSQAFAQERGDIPLTPVDATTYLETDTEISFLLALSPAEPPLLVSLPKSGAEFSQATPIANEISLWNFPKQHGDTPLATLPYFDANLVLHLEDEEKGLALFLQFDERAEEMAVLLFSWNPQAGTLGAFEPVGPLPESVLSHLMLPPAKDPEPAAVPPPPDFASVFGEEAGQLLDAMYRVASSGDPDSVRTFLALFLQLPPELQNWVVNFIAQTLLWPDSPYAPLAQYVEDYVAPAYTSYLENQAAIAATGGFVFAPEPTAASSERLEALAADAAADADPSETEWTPAVAFDNRENGSEDRGFEPMSAAALASLRTPSLARQDWVLDAEDISREAPKKGSRNGTQEISRARSATMTGAAQSALDRFFAGFHGHTFPLDAARLFFPENPERSPSSSDGEELFAVELRRRAVAQAKRA